MHIPVLLNEVIKYLDPKPGENFIDATIGLGGHTRAILEKNKPNGKVLGIDADLDSLKRIKPQDRLVLVHGNFRDLKKIVQEKKFGPINGILLDLGLSSWQIEEGRRGFSFQKDEALDMRFNPRKQTLTAADIINNLTEEVLKNVFRKYGEEKHSARIAKSIIRQRAMKPIKTTFDLRKIVEKTILSGRSRRSRINRVLARIFQSLRIVVNDELDNLKQGLEQTLEILESNGRLMVISFHSLEDRIVKNFFKEKAKNKSLEILTKKPIVAREEEIKNNPHSRSAKLRAIVKR